MDGFQTLPCSLACHLSSSTFTGLGTDVSANTSPLLLRLNPRPAVSSSLCLPHMLSSCPLPTASSFYQSCHRPPHHSGWKLSPHDQLPQRIYLWIVARFALFTMMPHLALCFSSSSVANALVQAPVICFLKDCEKPGHPLHDSGCLAHNRSTTPRSQDWAGSELGCEVRWYPCQARTHDPFSV